MTDESAKLAILQASADRRDQRRHFLKLAGGAAAIAGAAGAMSLAGRRDDENDAARAKNGKLTVVSASGGAAAGSATRANAAAADDTVTDADIFNFALNLEYLEAEFYSHAAFGMPLSDADTTGTGTRGDVVGGRKVNFTDPMVEKMAREIALDEIAHVRFIRSVLGSAAVARPQINIGTGQMGAFTTAARAAGLVGPKKRFDAYASDENFLLAAFIFEDVGVTAYKGSARLISNPTYIEAAGGLLGVEAYHAGLLRTTLYGKGIESPSLGLIESARKISNARDSLDGPNGYDQPLIAEGTDGTRMVNLVPADAFGIAFGRSAAQVLNIVYLNPDSVVGGGFLPNGANGTITASGANA